MRRIDASLKNASALRDRFSKSATETNCRNWVVVAMHKRSVHGQLLWRSRRSINPDCGFSSLLKGQVRQVDHGMRSKFAVVMEPMLTPVKMPTNWISLFWKTDGKDEMLSFA